MTGMRIAVLPWMKKGNIIDGDGIMYVCGTYMKEHGQLANDTVVTTVMSNIGLYRALEEKMEQDGTDSSR